MKKRTKKVPDLINKKGAATNDICRFPSVTMKHPNTKKKDKLKIQKKIGQKS